MPKRAALMPALVSLAMITAVAPTARADLHWEAPVSCPEFPAIDAVSPDVNLRAHVEQTVSGFEMVLTTDDGATQRIVAPSCGELVEALVIIWSLVRIPSSSEPHEVLSSVIEPAAELAAPRETEMHAAPPADESVEPADPIEIGVSLAAALEVGATPAPAPGIAGGLAIGASRWRVASTFTFFPPLTYSSEFGIEEGIFAIAIDGCGFVLDDTLRIAGCGGLETGVAWASAIHTPVRNTAFEPIFGVRAGIELLLRVVDWLGVRVDVFAMAPVLRPRFVVRDPETEMLTTVHQPSEIAFRAIAGLEARF